MGANIDLGACSVSLAVKDTEDFTDIRELQRELMSKGVEVSAEIDDSTEGPASFFITDPDGNAILIDQHR